MLRKVGLLTSVLVMFSAVTFAATDGHAKHHTKMAAPSAQSASIAAYQAINDNMHQAMNINFTGDADVDFVRGMIPHHEGAVEMAKVVLEHGSDPKIRALAQAVIAAQEEEISMMQQWLAERGLN
ncbi:DUF305 domain-containing protein [Vibrio metschnikovii]|uniref:DUF305 domain-containing protein n=4 Tax=Unclassified Bacteria TaxID=49928 RepID=A0AAU6SUB1_UNCXX|nr:MULTISPECIES: DUF305 domain-containing protein [Vibrio]EKO3567598.1 DUF305 domain-containing protein [Vibrio metschnikovii]EKO3571328.1 DUF305 domain-containing protein [Vibrio metschnikovii]EKO3574427.1 DUF305 domain-containing protein [Vibrio metschnikovii]EKO3578751.1 DUF305 domain-containing protein [Vibrio metschnikovii]EKO3584879.1 DUF305 domain-containing protein [Vibrio metschnikovii]